MKHTLIHSFVLLIIACMIVPVAFAAGTADLDGNGRIDIFDYNILVTNFAKTGTAGFTPADIDGDGDVDIFDFNTLVTDFGKTTTTTPAPTIPPVGQVKGIWISTDEIMKLPMTGAAWDRVRNAAQSNWGSACLHDNNCMHDVHTLAGALVSVRTNDSAMRAKVISGLQSAMGSSLSRALELSRGLQTYIIAADIIGYHEPTFEDWVRRMLTVNVSGHSGTGVQGTAYNASNNWGGHARASVAAAAVYLNDNTYMQKLLTAHKAFIGLPAPGNTMVYNDSTWHADSNNKAGVNRKNTVRDGKNISGVLPEDWRRASYNFVWPPATTGYMWEGMQGYVVTSVILHRAGVLSFESGDNAVARAMDMLYAKGDAASNSPAYVNSASGDDTWIPWVVNYYLNENRYPTQAASPGKNMGWTDWTHGSK